MVKRTPDWANGNRGEQWAPTRLRDYADFMVAAARHYRTVKHWMVWGEPTRGDSFKPMPPNATKGPRLYARMLDQAYGALKGVRRSNVVIGGMTWTVGVVPASKFVRWMKLPNGKPPRLDWFGHNPFSVRFPRLSKPAYNDSVRDMSDVDTLHREVKRAYRSRHKAPAPVAVGVHRLRAPQQPRLLLPRERAPAGPVGHLRLQDRLHRIATSPGSAGTRCSMSPNRTARA